MAEVNSSQPPYLIVEHPINEPRPLRAIVVGAGAAGLNFAYATQKYLQNVSLVIYEKNAAIGGTWLENKYPGIRCDIPAHNYQFSWSLNPDWTEFYATGPEILKYFQDTAKKHDLEKYVKLRHKVVGAVWNEEHGAWSVDVQNEATGEVFKDRAEFLINASGFLNNWKWPDIPGLHSFGGQLTHTADWKEGLDLKGKTVAVLGNGSTGIQLLPQIQTEAKQVVNFIRSPTWITTSFAQNHAGPGGSNFECNTSSTTEKQTQPANLFLDSDQQKQEFKDDPDKFHKYRKALEEEICARFDLVLKDSDAQAQAKALLAEYMKQRLGKDNPLAERLVPDFGVLCRRASPGIGYLEAMNEKNVRVVLDPIDAVVTNGVRLQTGDTVPIDVLICATGFDLSWKPRFPILGRDGINLQDQFDVRPVGYLGISAPNMPNYLVYFGPNSPLAHGSALPSFEHITTYMIRMIHKAQTQGYHSFEPSKQAVSDFVEHADAFFPRTIWSTKCRSWFKGGKEEGPVYALHPGSRVHWVHMMNEPRYEDYTWKTTNRNVFSYLGNGFSVSEVENKDVAWFLDEPEAGYRSVIY
ncbi:putative sterigmatocystin biosynthesis monooxygenase stcW [Fusarium oxysporum]|uniref:Putative sterigmatocystin biosynthesis monooxygenase stcW n=1 Tax=Fusarium oxysporum TaxID=5507 RepID=A0A420P5T2_FUSOX|nr:putative sterigmatocystin biosynthesis monooxygenase stcW [Fusarium oxysporum f. sp. cepae]RKK26746.1 putative sterigmatocystin biosynthesis monooxygenase stcW [Fusarium oxysporum f. sp. cepae]RKK87865.1 putative sterigmatocystin biosynthesis monooxygenase stcW [Fusarium oxysporum]